MLIEEKTVRSDGLYDDVPPTNVAVDEEFELATDSFLEEYDHVMIDSVIRLNREDYETEIDYISALIGL